MKELSNQQEDRSNTTTNLLAVVYGLHLDKLRLRSSNIENWDKTSIDFGTIQSNRLHLTVTISSCSR